MARSTGTLEMTGVPMEGSPSSQAPEEDRDWLELSNRAYRDSLEHYRAEHGARIQMALDHFHGRHDAKSKFSSPNFPAQRSSLFRPKSRQLANKFLSQAANAFFATSDVVQVTAANDGDKDSSDAAKFRRAVLNYRLNKTVPWFKMVSAAVVEAFNNGVAITRQYWRREMRKIAKIENGRVAFKDDTSKDCAFVDLVPFENLLLHPQTDWLDPINNSPYVIFSQPRHVNDIALAIRRRKEQEDAAMAQAGMDGFAPDIYGIPYYQITKEELWKYTTTDSMEVSAERGKRNKNKTDAKQRQTSDPRLGTVTVRCVIYRQDDIDWYFETIGDVKMLSKPVPLSIAQYGYPERPYKMGSVWSSPNSVYPEGTTQLIADMQRELNENINQRIDNMRPKPLRPVRP